MQVRWGQLYGSATSLWLAEAARKASGPLLVIAADARQASRIEDELRFFAEPGTYIEAFPDWETLPYDLFSPHPDIVSQRLRMLSALPRLAKGIVIVDLETLLQRLAPQTYIDGHAFDLSTGERLDVAAFRERLTRAGYVASSQVMAPGEFAVRGSLIDLFPMGSDSPYRIDLFDDEVETIRTFDPETQRSGERRTALRLLPAREFPLTADGIQAFKRRFRNRFPGDLTRMSLYRDIAEGAPPAGIEYYLPLFFDCDGDAVRLPAREHDRRGRAGARRRAPSTRSREIEGRYEQRSHDAERPILAPAEVFMPPAELMQRLSEFRQHRAVAGRARSADADAALPELRARARRRSLRVDARSEDPARELIAFLGRVQGPRADRRRIGGPPRDAARHPAATAGSAPSWSRAGRRSCAATRRSASPSRRSPPAWCCSDPPVALIAEEQLFGERARQERRRRRPERDPEKIIRDLTDLHPGSPVVHEEYGVGRFVGLATLDVGGLTSEFLLLEYADGDKLYVPVQALDLVSRYTGAPAETAPLHKLGSDAWEKAKKKAAQRIRDTAAELLDLYSRRAARQGEQLAANEADLRAFEAAFPFEETPDQAQAIEQVIADLRAAARWIASSAATSASARPKWRCAPRSSPSRRASRSPCWCRRRCSRSSTTRRSRIASPTGRCEVESLSRFRSAREVTQVLREPRERPHRHRRRHASAAAERRAASSGSAC